MRRPLPMAPTGCVRESVSGAQRSTSAAGQQRGEAALLNGPLHVVVGRRLGVPGRRIIAVVALVQ